LLLALVQAGIKIARNGKLAGGLQQAKAEIRHAVFREQAAALQLA
jgi:hypothetical protein